MCVTFTDVDGNTVSQITPNAQTFNPPSTHAQVVLIFDEITCGFRLCAGGAHLLFGVNPDIAVFGKGWL